MSYTSDEHYDSIDSCTSDLFRAASPDEADERLDHEDLTALAEVKAKVLHGPRELVRIGRFEVLGTLGAGGMGKVYEARDPGLGRRVAIKLHQELTTAREQHERMRREARVLARLVHDNVVRVYEVGEHDLQVYVVMELVRGQTLEELQQAGPLPWRRAVQLYAMAGHGLQAAHEQEIVHRDFKPANVVVDRGGRSKVLDFGVARELSVRSVEEPARARLGQPGTIERVPEPVLTGTGVVLGSPAYMAPEVHRGEPATPRSDQFSFCVALYEAVHGERPYLGATKEALWLAKLKGPPPARKAGPRVPPWLLALLRRGLAVDPRDRYGSMVELLADLERSRARSWQWLTLSLAFTTGACAVVAASADHATLPEDPRLRHGRAQVGACLDVAQGVRERWVAASGHLRLEDELEDVRAVTDLAVTRFAQQVGSACLESDPRFQGCWEQVDRDFAALSSRVEASAPLLSTSVSGLAYDFALCLEDVPSGTCAAPHDDGGSAEALSDAKSELAVGRPGPAEALAKQALALAQARSDRLGEVRARILLGEIYDQIEAVDEARAVLDEAIARAAGCDATVPTIDALLQRIEVELHHRASGRMGSTSLLLALARELLARAPQGLAMRRALLDEKQAGVLLAQPPLDAAECKEVLGLYRSVLARRRDALRVGSERGRPSEPLLRQHADAELNLANALLACSAAGPSTVIELFETARRDLAEALGGHAHPDLAAFDFGLGRALAGYGRYAEAVHHYEAALDTYVAFGAAGEAGANVGDVHLALAQTLRRLGRLDEAWSHVMINLELRRAHARARSPLVMAEALGLVGVLALEREDFEQARRYHQGAIDELERAASTCALEGRERQQLAGSYANLALALCGLERPRESSEAFERARTRHDDPSGFVDVADALREHECLP